MESRSSPLLIPVSPSTLTSPPPLSSAGLSSRINTVHPRLSTLLPNPSGYLAFFSRNDKSTEGIKRERERSNSFSTYFREIPKKLNRSFSSTRHFRSKRLNVSPKAQEYRRCEEKKVQEPVQEKKDKSEWKEIENEWKLQAKLLKQDYKNCLSGARCISITDPVGDLTDEYLQSTVIISSNQDPFPNLPQLPHRSPRRRSFPELKHSTSPSISSKPNLSPIPPSPPSDPASSRSKLRKTTEADKGQPKEQEEENDGNEDDYPRILDVRAGTASTSTRRVPTQKSVRPTLGGHISEDSKDVEEQVTTGQPMQNKDYQYDKSKDISSSAIETGQDRSTYDVTTTNVELSFPTNTHGSKTTPSHLVRPSAPVPPSTSAARQSSLVLNPDEYDYLLSLQALGMQNGTTPHLRSSTPNAAFSPRARSPHKKSTSIASSGSSSTIRPMVPGNDTLNNETPIYSPSPEINVPLSVQVGPSHNNISTYSPPSAPLTNQEAKLSDMTGGRNIYREHLRRAVVQHYNESPTPSKTARAQMLTTSSNSEDKKGHEGNGKGLRRALGRGVWYKKTTG